MREWMKCVLVIVVAVGIIALVTWLQSLGIPTGFGVKP
jgi:hypothetical protein